MHGGAWFSHFLPGSAWFHDPEIGCLGLWLWMTLTYFGWFDAQFHRTWMPVRLNQIYWCRWWFCHFLFGVLVCWLVIWPVTEFLFLKSQTSLPRITQPWFALVPNWCMSDHDWTSIQGWSLVVSWPVICGLTHFWHLVNCSTSQLAVPHGTTVFIPAPWWRSHAENLYLCTLQRRCVLHCSRTCIHVLQWRPGEILMGAIDHFCVVLHGSYKKSLLWGVPQELFCMAKISYFRATGVIFPRLVLI
jgi:hypothetical protein